MSYQFQENRFYRMPTHFGPSLGPRQGLSGQAPFNLKVSKDLIIQATFSADSSQLDKLLPPGFSLRCPHVVNLSFSYSKNIEWLAGRGYNTFGISVPVTYKGKQDTVDGDLLLVLWENMADPIITGREDLGFAKVYCDLPEPQFLGDKVICRASWDGCQFATLQLTGLEEIALEDLPESEPSEGVLHYKYIPKTSAPGEAEVEYPVLSPMSSIDSTVKLVKVAENAICSFRHSTWEELPTLVHIVNALSELKLGDCTGATLMKSQGGANFSDQRILY